MPDITLTKIYNPLNRGDQDTITWEHRPGLTVADLLDHTGARLGMAHRDSLALVVSVDGRAVPASQYTTTTLMPGQHVTLMPVLTGGGGGKDVLRMVGMVVLAIVATVAQQYWATALVASGWGATAATAISMVGAAAIMVGGSMLINSLLPPVMPKNPALNGYGSIDQSNSYSWNPQNTQQQGIAIPWHYGTCKLHGNVIGVYRETIGKDVYLNALISIGAGVLSGLSDFKINGQPYGNYRGIELHTRLGHLTQETIPNFGDTKVEYPLGTKVVYGAPVTYSTIGSNFDGLEVEVGFPNGLYYYDDYGKLQNFSVNFSVEIKKQGDATWTPLTKSVYQYYVSSGGYWSAGYWATYNHSYTEDSFATETVWEELANGGTDPNSHYPGQYYSKHGTWRWIGPELKIANGINNYVTAGAASTGAVMFSYKDWDLEPGTYDVRVTRLTADQTDTRYGDDFYLTAVREVMQDDFTYPGQALIGLRALATDQLSGSFSFECRTTGKLCRVYNGSTWSVAATSNPAWVCFDILTQPVFDASLNVLEYAAHDPANLDLSRWYEWAQYCDDLVPDGNGGTEPRLTYNGTFDAVQSMWDAALSVAKIGRATPYWRGTTITIAIDKPADPVALITVGNIGLDSFEETFLSMENRAGSIEADFLNLDKDLARDKFTVINPSAPAEWGSTSLPLQGVIRPSEVWRHCRYYLATTQNLTRVVTVNMDTDSIAFTLGDVINVQHDVPMWGEGGRLVSATSNSITIDREVTIESGKTYAVMIRLLDGTLVERTISDAPGSYTTLTVSTPFATVPEQYDVYAFGETSLVVKPMRVVGIDPAGDLKRKVSLTDYNATVYNADSLDPVSPTINYSAPNLPPVTNLAAAERIIKRHDGGADEYVVVTFTPPVDTTNWKMAEIWVLGSGLWTKVGESETGSEILFKSDALQTYIIKAVSIDRAGGKLADNLCPSVVINAYGNTAAPANVSGFTAVLALPVVKLNWTHTADIDRLEYVIRLGADWDTATEIGRTTGNTWTYQPTASGTLIFWIKAINTSQNPSDLAASASVVVPAAAAPTAITASPIMFGIALQIAHATTADIDYCEVWAATGNDRATAVQVGITRDGAFNHEALGNAATRYYWARTRNKWDEPSAWYPLSATGGVQASTIADPSDVIKLLNSDVTNDALIQYLAGTSGIIDLLDTASMVLADGVTEPGVTANYRQHVTFGDTIALYARDRISLSLDKNGRVAGMVMGWLQPDVSEIAFYTNVFKIANPDAPEDTKAVFTTGMVNGTQTVGINGELIVDGTILARHLAANQLTVGENVAMGPNAYISWSNVSGRPNTTYIDENGIYTGTLTADQVTAGTFTGRTFQTTASTSADRIIIDAATNRQTFTGLNRQSGGTYVNIAQFGTKATTGLENYTSIISAGDDVTGVVLLPGGYSVDPSTASDLVGIQGKSALSYGIVGTSIQSIGVRGSSSTGRGVFGYSRSNYGGEFQTGGGSTTHGKAPLRVVPASDESVPNHAADIGALWVTSTGILYINTSGSTTWQKVGAQ